MNFTKIITIFSMSLLIFFSSCLSDQANQKSKRRYITIGTGGVTGVYYPTGGAISRMVQKEYDKYKLKMTVESTSGSVFNVNSVMTGDLQFGIVQSDKQYQAWHGQKEWEKRGKQSDLRSVFSIHPENVTLVASDKSGIKTISDLLGKRVNLGGPGSGQLGNSNDILAAFNIQKSQLNAEFVKAVEAPGLIQDERIDAFFYTVGHPSGNIKEATSGRIKVRIIPVSGEPIDKLIKKYPYYVQSHIPVKIMYPNALNETDVPSLGVKATLVTSQKVDKSIVYAVTKEVFENFEAFKKLHPAYQVLTKESMLQGLTAPIHEGALKYYKESGLLKYIQ